MASKSPPTPQTMSCLHDIVIDYVINSGYADTARVLAEAGNQRRSVGAATAGEPSASSEADAVPTRGDMDMDHPVPGSNLRDNGKLPDRPEHAEGTSDSDGAVGDGAHEPESGGHGGHPSLDRAALELIDQRRSVLQYIINGDIPRAIEALNLHFPAVLNPTTAGALALAGLRNGASGNGNDTNGVHTNGRSATNGASTTNGASHSDSRIVSSSSTQVSQAAHSSSPSTTRSHAGATNAGTEPDRSIPVFSSSLDPDHIKLNLKIQQYIESFRVSAEAGWLSAPSSPSSSLSSLPGAPGTAAGNASGGAGGGAVGGTGGGNSNAALISSIIALQGLHTDAHRLRPEHRAVYLQELRDVGALFAYNDPCTSVLRGFLEPERKEMLAQQVNAAILSSQGLPVQSHLEQIARRTSAIYATLSEHGIDPSPNWTTNAAVGGAAAQRQYRIAEQLKRRPFENGGFNLRHYVEEMA